MAEKRTWRNYSEEFKHQMVQLYNAGKSRTEIIREYDLTSSALDQWINRINNTGSTRECDNHTPGQKELLKLNSLA